MRLGLIQNLSNQFFRLEVVAAAREVGFLQLGGFPFAFGIVNAASGQIG